MIEPIILTTEHKSVEVRSFVPSEAALYLQTIEENRGFLNSAPGTPPPSYASLTDLERGIEAQYSQNKMHFGIWKARTLLGSLALINGSDDAEIGYWLAEQHTGNGYATVATRALSSYARYRYKRVFAEVVGHNPSSVRVLQRCDFQFVNNDGEKAIYELAQE